MFRRNSTFHPSMGQKDRQANETMIRSKRLIFKQFFTFSSQMHANCWFCVLSSAVLCRGVVWNFSWGEEGDLAPVAPEKRLKFKDFTCPVGVLNPHSYPLPWIHLWNCVLFLFTMLYALCSVNCVLWTLHRTALCTVHYAPCTVTSEPEI